MNNYNFIQKFFHDLVFTQNYINKILFEVEKFFLRKKEIIIDQDHLFITGLPRSGTTSILNFIYSSEEFASLKYLNMPFILSPNFSKLFHKSNVIKKERLHEDGITYDLNSPESFDEVFFNNNSKFIQDELLNYIKLIMISQNKVKYLSKNNLNYKRITLINSILPNSKFLIPIRHPLQHSYSILNQHLHFIKLQKKEDFIRRYMNYLGHNEFGLDHKAWNKPINFNNLEKIDYWLEQWTLFYEKIFKDFQFNQNCFFLIYEELSNPNYIEKLLEKIGLHKNKNINLNYFKNSNKKKIDTNFNQKNFEHAMKVYEKFIE